jgi:8-oxo-dGTP pyrophosphatase MutT (NUDIX family)
MKCSRMKIRKIITEILLEQFTIPKGNNYSGFELYTEEDIDEGTDDNLKKKSKGAGFLIGKIFPNGDIKFLGLEGKQNEKTRKKGIIYDIPKGKLKKIESDIEGAKRECMEESGISVMDSDIIGDPVSFENLTIFLASTDQKPIINPNPDSGKIEHNSHEWLSKTDIENNCLDYLAPFIKILTKRFINSIEKN